MNIYTGAILLLPVLETSCDEVSCDGCRWVGDPSYVQALGSAAIPLRTDHETGELRCFDVTSLSHISLSHTHNSCSPSACCTSLTSAAVLEEVHSCLVVSSLKPPCLSASALHVLLEGLSLCLACQKKWENQWHPLQERPISILLEN